MQQSALVEVSRRVRFARGAYVLVLAGRRVRFRMPAKARAAFRRPKRTSPAEWAARYYILGDESARPGPWRRDVTPYLLGPLYAYGLPYVREEYVCAPPQTGKTTVLLICMGSDMDQDPGPMMLIMDVESTAREMMTKRVLPMIRLSPRLRRLQTGKDDDMSAQLVTLETSTLYPAWARSISRLANKPIKRVLGSEVDKWARDNSTEAGPVSLARKRIRTFKHTGKVLLESSPSVPDGPIWTVYQEAEARFDYFVRCPLCGHFQTMHLTRSDGSQGLRWPDDERDHVRIQSQSLAWYECEHCAGSWDDYRRDQASAKGEWREKETGLELAAFCDQYRPKTVGFHYSALVSSFVPLAEIAAAFVKADKARKVGDLEPLKDFMNGYLAEPWVEDIQQRDAEVVKALRDERPFGKVPGGGVVAALLGTADSQDDGFWFEIRAWGWGEERESWQVRTGFVESLDALERIFWDDAYTDAEGNLYTVGFASIDAMGHRTDEVYEWCVRNRGRVLPLQGVDSLKMPAPWEWSKPIEYYPGSDKARPIPGGLRLLRLKSDHYKGILARKLQILATDPGAWHMAKDMTDDWAQQMCAETKDERGHWSCSKGTANHAWDVSYYQLGLADMIGIRYWSRDGVTQEQDRKGEQSGSGSRPGARERRSRW